MLVAAIPASVRFTGTRIAAFAADRRGRIYSAVAGSITVLTRVTKDWTVERLAQHLAQWRLQLAADLVRTTDLGVAEIAGRVGYESEAAFSRAFKRQFGASPATVRGSPEPGAAE